MANHSQNYQKNTTFTIKIDCNRNGIYPDNSYPLPENVGTEIHNITCSITSTSNQNYTYQPTTSSQELVNTQLAAVQVARHIEAQGTTPQNDPVDINNNDIIYDLNLKDGYGAVRYHSYNTIDTTPVSSRTFISNTRMNQNTVVGEYKEAYVKFNDTVYKSYSDVWGTDGSIAPQSGEHIVFEGWKIGATSTVVTATSDYQLDDPEVIHTSATMIVMDLYPVFTTNYDYTVTVVVPDSLDSLVSVTLS